MTDKDLSRELWQITNLLTGFAIIQTIAFTYACARLDFAEMINTPMVKMTIAIHIIIVTLVECYAVWWCVEQTVSLLKEDRQTAKAERTQRIIKKLGWGRIVVIVTLLVPTFLSLYAPQLTSKPIRNNAVPNGEIQANANTSHRRWLSFNVPCSPR